MLAGAFPWLMRFVPMMIDRTPAGKAILSIIDTSAKLIEERKASGVKVCSDFSSLHSLCSNVCLNMIFQYFGPLRPVSE